MPGSVMTALFRKKTADLSRGAYYRGARVQLSNRSKFNGKPEDAACELGMGIVQALLAALTGHVVSLSWIDGGKAGTVHLFSTSSDGEYDFTWDESQADLGLYGGFRNGPTYQLAVLHLVLCYLDLRRGGSERSAEVMERWFALTEAMQQSYAHGFLPDRGWSKRVVGDACWDRSIQPLIERVADSLWFAMRYRVPNLSLAREMDLFTEQVIQLPLSDPQEVLAGAMLFARPMPAALRFSSRKRQEQELPLDALRLAQLERARPRRIEGMLPAWHFPSLDDR
jgi:hypothetical protein